MKTPIHLVLTGAFTFAWSLPAAADFTLVLKNGRRITVQSYREEGNMIKFHGLGGEIGLSKDQIQTIHKAGDGERQDLSLPAAAVSSSRSSDVNPVPSATQQTEPKESTATEQTRGQDSPSGELDDEKRLREITEQLENARKRYYTATQGGGISANVSKEGFNAWIADLGSRIKDSQKAPLSEYTPKMRELSQLRIQIDKLEKERDALLKEMKAKSSPTNSF